MAQRFAWASPPLDATWDQVMLFRASTLTGTYNPMSPAYIAAKDSVGNWVSGYFDETGGIGSYYKIQNKNSVSGATDALSDPIGSDTVATLSYTSPQKVAAQLQVKQFGGDTRPSIWDVIDLIADAEDEIDYLTGHAWRQRFSKSQKGSDTVSPEYENYNFNTLANFGRSCIKVSLKHRMIRAFDATKGDVLQIWNGNAFTNYIADRVAGRNGDYFVNYEKGVVYVFDQSAITDPEPFQTKYRFGETSVPGDIHQLATLMVCYNLGISDDRSYLIPDGGNSMTLDSKVTRWKERADDILFRRTGMRTSR